MIKPLTQLEAGDIKDIKLVCFDCDGVTVKKGTDISETETTLTVKTNLLEPRVLEKLKKLKKYFHVNFSSGRSLMYLDRMYGKVLWDNASLQGENGIFTLINGEVIQHLKFDRKTLEIMNNIKVDLRDLANHNSKARGFEPKQFLITLHAWEAIDEVEQIVRKYDPQEDFYVWWNGEAYDIGLKILNKGTALKNLTKLLGIDISQTIAIGNGPNDKDMVVAAGIGVTADQKGLDTAHFYTTKSEELGGEELIDRLLELKGE